MVRGGRGGKMDRLLLKRRAVTKRFPQLLARRFGVCLARSTKDIRQRIIALMAGVFVNRTLSRKKRIFQSPWFRKRLPQSRLIVIQSRDQAVSPATSAPLRRLPCALHQGYPSVNSCLRGRR